MTTTDRDWMHLCDEHGRIVREYGRAQQRASDVIDEQARRIAALEAQVMHLRAAAVIRETALVWIREELEAVTQAMPGPPKRLARARQDRGSEAVPPPTRGNSLAGRTDRAPQAAGHARAVPSARHGTVVVWISQDHLRADGAEPAIAKTGVRLVGAEGADTEKLDAGLADADLVLCQAGCVSYGDWWRVRDYCSRTGKQCVLVEQPDALDRVIDSRVRTPIGTTK